METRAHFIIIGLFTILGIIGGLGFFLWLASVQIDRQYAQYGVLFDDVSGLNQSADVLFNGVNVGRVIDIRIWENNPSKVFVAVEIDAQTPIAVDTMAQLESQGVTGVAYIALSGGSPGSKILEPPEVGVLPIIPSRQSSFQSLVASAPDLLGDASVLIKQIEQITGPDNQQTLAQVLQNVEAATSNLDSILAEFAEILPSVRTAADDVSAFAANLNEIGTATRETLANMDTTLTNAADKLDAAGPAIANFDAAFASINALVADDLSPLAGDIKDTLSTTDDAITHIDDVFSSAQDLLNTDIDPIIADARAAMSSFDETMDAARDVLNTDFEPVITDARTAMSAFADAMKTAEAEVPALLTDLRAATGDVRSAIATAVPGLRDFGRLGSEARTVVRSITDLVRQLSREPAQLLFDNRVPDYRR